MRDDILHQLAVTAWQRLHRLDPLLPTWAEPLRGCGATFIATDPSGMPVAVADCEHWTAEPGSFSLTWGAAHRFRIAPRIAGADAGDALD